MQYLLSPHKDKVSIAFKVFLMSLALGTLVSFYSIETLAVVFGLILLAIIITFPQRAFLLLGILLIGQASLEGFLAAYEGTSLFTLIKNFDELALIVFTTVAIGRKLFRSERIAFPALPIFVVFMFSNVISILLNYGDRDIFIAVMDVFLAIKGALIVFISANFDFEKKHIDKFISQFIKAMSVISLLGIVQFFTGTLFGIEMIGRYDGLDAATSIFPHHSTLGSLAAFGCIFSYVMYTHTKEKKYLVYFSLIFAGLFVSTVRRALFGVLAAIFIMSVLLKKEHMRATWFLLAGALLAIPFMATIGDNLIGELKYVYIDNFAATPRGALYLGALEILKTNPLFGIGPGGYGGFMSTTYDNPIFVQVGVYFKMYLMDTYYAHLFGELGLVGAFAFLGWITSLLVRTFKLRKNNLITAPALISFCILILSFIEAIASNYYESTLLMYFGFSLIGAMYSKHFVNYRKNDTL